MTYKPRELRPDPRVLGGRRASPLAWLLVAGLLALVSAVDVARAEPVRYRLAPEHGMLAFKATSRLMDADGRFHRFEGEVRADPKALDQARVSLVIEARSVDTGITRRDSHLRSADFFDVERFPRILFASQRVAPVEGKVLVTGRLTLHGVSREVTVPVEIGFEEKSLRARGEFTIRMSEYGINYRSFFNPIRDEIRVIFDLRGLADGAPDV